ncbi:unnamed protein product [Adineta steineri]|uniref:mitogen-activated protein kinase kinase n=1 Tax=Adineta steineri TaxID=433720 RepID=A0A815GDR6_9BILA|nr:unnamed protein product [Adineta steineri]
MANPQENLFVDTNNGEECDQPQNSDALDEALCVPEPRPVGTNIGATNLLTNISTTNKTVDVTFGVATPTPTGVSPFNNHEIPQPSESGNSKIPENSTVFTYDQTIIPIDVSQLHKCAKISHDGYFGEVYSVNIKNPREMRMAVKRIPFRTDENSRLSTYAELSTMEMIGSGNTPYIIDYYCSMIDLNTRELCICMELMDTSIAKFYQAMHRLPELSPKKLNRFVQRCAYNVVRALYYLESKNIVHRDVKPANILINKDGKIKLCDFGICGNLTDRQLDFDAVVVRALYYLESKNIVHRDVKPANILINKDGKIKLCDFGICGNLTDRQLDFDAVVGTAMYLPPEPEKCAIQGDMWALGISLIEIIAGKHPFADYQSYGIAYKIKEWEPVVPTTVSVDTQAFILQLLRKEAGERPRSYKDIINYSFIRHMTEIPPDDEIDFIQRVIEESSSFSSISGG